jgi:hypothetical protein
MLHSYLATLCVTVRKKTAYFYAEDRILSVFTLNVSMLSVVMLNVSMLSVVMLNVSMLIVVILRVTMLCVVMLISCYANSQ